MKNINQYSIFLFAVTILLWLSGCRKEEEISDEPDHYEYPYEPPAVLPEGYFEVRFATAGGNISRSAVDGLDGRVQHVRYIIYKSTGEFVKEKIIWTPSHGAEIDWPLPYIKDTLPNGSYNAIFLGNVDSTLFDGDEVLSEGYRTNYNNARIMLPNSEFSSNTEFYWSKTSFSDQAPAPSVLLQRIVGSAVLHRNLIDAQKALDTLIYNIVTVKGYENLVGELVSDLLPGLLEDRLGGVGGGLLDLVGGVDVLVNALVGQLVEPLTGALYDILLQKLIEQVGMALTGNVDQEGILSGLGALLNPWNSLGVTSAIVTIDGFPKSVDFNLDIAEHFPDGTKFKFDFTNLSVYDLKDIAIRGFGHSIGAPANWQIQTINIARPGVVTGVVIDGVVDDLLLDNALADIGDLLSIRIEHNRRWKNNYSVVNLELNSSSEDETEIGVNLADVLNLDNILGGIPILGGLLLEPLVDALLEALEGLTVSIPISLPIVNTSDLVLSGSWDEPVPY